MRLLSSLTVSIAIVIPFDYLSAQQPPPLEAGARVRVMAPDCGIRTQTARFDAWRGDTLALDTMDCPLGSVTRLEVSRGRRSWGWWKGALIGLFGGGGIGGGIGALSCDPDMELYGLCPAVGAVLGGGIGLVSGIVVGTLIKTDRWEEVPLDRLRVSFAPSRDGRFALGLRIEF